MIYESVACTSYGKVTVAAQWQGAEFWLIGIGKNAGTIYRPGFPPQRTYFCNVFNLIAHSKHGYFERPNQ